MKKSFFLLLFALCAACTTQDMTPVAPRSEENHVRQSILPGRAEIFLTEEAAEGFSPESFLRAASPLGVLSVERIFPDAGEFEARHRAAGLHRWYRIRYDEDLPATKAQEGLSALPGVQSVGFPRRKERRGAIFNDEFLEFQWQYINDGSLGAHFKKGIDINVEPVWQEFTGGDSDVIVAVIDGGIDLSHEDLQGVVLRANEGSRNFVGSPNRIPADDHGTHVAGTIGAINNNGIGVCGIAGGRDGKGGVRLMSCVIFVEEDGGNGDEDAQALIWAADHGAVIANNSWGYDCKTEEEAARTATAFMEGTDPDMRLTKTAIDYFIDHAGMDASGNQTGPMKGGVVFFASGNDGWSHDAPSEYEPVIAVGAFGPDGKMAKYSNYGSWVDILAPGGSDTEKKEESNEWIGSTGAGGDYFYLSGTSMACPHASGVAALLVSYFGGPGFTNEDLRERLLGGARTSVLEMPYGRSVGGGMLDAYGAFTYKQGADPDKPDIRFSTDYNGDYRIKSHETVDIVYTISGNEKARLAVDVASDCPGLSSSRSSGRATLHIEALKANPGDYTAVIRVGDAATKTVPFTILENHAPVLTAPIDDQIVNAASSGFTSVDLSAHFRDPDGETLSYSVTVSQEGILITRLSGQNLSLGAVDYGQVEVTIAALDARGARCQTTFRLLARDAFQQLDVYPNPVTGFLYVRPATDTPSTATLYSRSGAKVCSVSQEAGPFQPMCLDLRDCAPGIYTLDVEFGGKRQVKNIVKK